MFYNFVEFIILLYTFLVNSLAQYKGHIICLISFSKFLDVFMLLFVHELLVILSPSPLVAFI